MEDILIIIVWLGKMRVEKVQFHVIVRPSFLVGKVLSSASGDVASSFILFCGTEEEHVFPVDFWCLHVKGSVSCRLFEFNCFSVLYKHGPYIHFPFEVTGFFEIHILSFGVVDTSGDGLELFRQPVRSERFHVGHLSPFVSSPTLYHHEQVECLSMGAVVAFEIKSRVFHESPDFAGE